MPRSTSPASPRILLLLLAPACALAQNYVLPLHGGHVIDAKSNLRAVRDVASKGRVIAAIAPRIDPASAFKTVNVAGLYVTPGLIDIHVHVFAGTGARASSAGD